MGTLPCIDLAATGTRIVQLRQQAGLTVQDLQNIFGFVSVKAETSFTKYFIAIILTFFFVYYSSVNNNAILNRLVALTE